MGGSGVCSVARACPRRARRGAGERGFTFVELLVGLTLFAGIAVFLLQAFLAGMTYANRSDTQAAATSIAVQLMEQIKASPNPYSMVGFTDVPRTPLPLPSPYTGIANPTPHTFQVSVTVTPDSNLIMSTVTVRVYQPSDPDSTPTATLTTVLDAQ